MSSPVNNSVYDAMSSFAHDHPYITAGTLGLVLLGCAVLNLGGRFISWLEGGGKVDDVAQQHFEMKRGMMAAAGTGATGTKESGAGGGASSGTTTAAATGASTRNQVHANNRNLDQASFEQLTVLDQTYRNGGEVECGYHALKNALAFLYHFYTPYNSQSLYDHDSILTDKPTFEALANYVKTKHGWASDRMEDASIPMLTQALHGLQQDDPNSLDPHLQPLAEMLRRSTLNSSTISFINIGSVGRDSVDHLIFGRENFESLLNLQELAKQLQEGGDQGAPRLHTICVGDTNSQHWVTLAVTFENGEIKLFGTDSYRNQTSSLPRVQRFLGYLLERISTYKPYLADRYENEAGRSIRRRAGYITNPAREEDRRELVIPRDKANPRLAIDSNLRDIQSAWNFIQRTGWVNEAADSPERQHYENLKTFAAGFQALLQDNDPAKNLPLFAEIANATTE